MFQNIVTIFKKELTRQKQSAFVDVTSYSKNSCI